MAVTLKSFMNAAEAACARRRSDYHRLQRLSAVMKPKPPLKQAKRGSYLNNIRHASPAAV